MNTDKTKLPPVVKQFICPQEMIVYVYILYNIIKYSKIIWYTII